MSASPVRTTSKCSRSTSTSERRSSLGSLKHTFNTLHSAGRPSTTAQSAGLSPSNRTLSRPEAMASKSEIAPNAVLLLRLVTVTRGSVRSFATILVWEGSCALPATSTPFKSWMSPALTTISGTPHASSHSKVCARPHRTCVLHCARHSSTCSRRSKSQQTAAKASKNHRDLAALISRLPPQICILSSSGMSFHSISGAMRSRRPTRRSRSMRRNTMSWHWRPEAPSLPPNVVSV
mmetsp:Transcript_103195/g.291399  ORF Transcript_103195/g.291399 Transcript_103195/m.291399 type:complete len:235 (-) Transcript_103195:247-951(-)